jgi:hypothetical protein
MPWLMFLLMQNSPAPKPIPFFRKKGWVEGSISATFLLSGFKRKVVERTFPKGGGALGILIPRESSF